MNGPVRLQDVPAGRFRQQLDKLPAHARDKALSNLEKHRIPVADIDSLNADSSGEIYYSCAISTPCAGCSNHAAHSDTSAALSAETAVSEPIVQNITTGSTGPDGGTASASDFNPPVAVPIASPPVFHSLPGATAVLFLDFNGGNITNTQWNSATASTLVCKPYDLDADPSTFSIAEQRLIHDAWKRVAEDFAPFNIDVTTEQPAQWTSTTGHVMITPDVDANGVDLPHKGNGGVAYLSVFGNSNYSYNYSSGPVTSPVWSQPLGNINTGNASALAQIISHEFGHNFSLGHHGYGANTYYDGHSSTSEAPSWGPIMGTAWLGNLTQWTNGEYFSATNAGQDDCKRISDRAGYRTDDHADHLLAASSLTGNSFTAEGLIGHDGDVDVFAIPSGGGTLSLSVQPHVMAQGTWGANLDVLLDVYDQSGALVTSSNPLDQVSASVSLTVSGGIYYAYVRPTGTGNPMADPPYGYTVYGSRGCYTISGTSTTPGTETSPAITAQPVSKTIGAGQDYSLSVTATGGYGLKYQWRKNGTPISGAGFSTLRLNPAAQSDTGSYDVVVSNSQGSVTSNAAQLTVVAQKANAGADQYVFLTGGTPWTPANLSALAWYDASDATTITGSGTISQWSDKTTNARHISQGTASAQPAYANNTVSFDGVDDHLWRSSAFMYANGQVDIYLIGSVPAGQTDARILGEGSSSSNNPMYSISQTHWSDSSLMHSYARNDGGAALLSSSFGSTDAYNGTNRIYQWRDTGSEVSGRYNGGPAGNVAYTRSGTMTLNRFAVGAIVRNTAAAWKACSVNEIVICNNLSDSDRQKLEGYLAHKWNRFSSLPSGHPYRSAPPVIGAVASATLDGTVGAAESGSLTTLWSKVDGPGTVNVNNASAVDTTATLTTQGSYNLRLSASDGDEYYEDRCQLIVLPETETYTVTYSGNGNTAGSPPAAQMKVKGIDLVLATNSGLVQTGHSLTGWNTAADGSGTHYAIGGTYSPDASATLYSEWTPLASTVTFHRNNASSIYPDPLSKSVSYGAPYGALATVSRTGYSFQGWFTEATGGTEVTAATVVSATDDHSLYAQWAVNSYPVTYSANEATSGTAPASQTKIYGQTLTLASNSGNLAKTNALFDGWNTLANGLGTNYAEGASFTANATLTLYAKWVNQATVSFDKQGGSGGSESVLATTTYAMPAATAPTRTGYNFGGYFTATGGGGTQYYSASMVSTSNWDLATNTTLYAYWIADSTAPTVASFNPADNATAVSIATNLDVTFSEPIAFGSGSITIYRSLDGMVVESFDIANPGSALSISGSTLTINPTGSLPHSAACHVLISAGAVQDIAGNSFAGISDSTTWNFATADEVLLADVFTGSTATAINDNLATRQSGSMAQSNYTVEAGADQKMSSNRLKTGHSQRVANNADFKSSLKANGLLGFTLSFKLENDGTSWVSSYLSTHSGTDDRSASRFGMHLWQNGNSTVLTAYSDSGSGQSSTNLSKATLEALLGSSFTASNLNTFTFVATPASTTAGTYDLFVNGVEALSDIPYLLGNGGGNSKISWESNNNSGGSCYVDNLSISLSPNRAPAWSSNPIAGADPTEGQAYSGSLAGVATDLDGQSLVYALVSAPTWLSVASNGTLSGTPGPTHTGPNNFSVSVSDGISTVQTTLNINVSAAGGSSYTLAYDGNGATAGSAPVDGSSPYASGGTVILAGQGTLLKTGHAFTGWNTAADGSGMAYAPSATFAIASHTTLYALWSANSYTVTFDANGGSTPSSSSQSVTHASTYGNLPTTSRSGYTFIGWFTAASGGTQVTESTTVASASNHTLYAKWSGNTQTLAATLNSVDQIVGERQTSATALGYYVGVNEDLVGSTGTSGSRKCVNLVMGYTLPTLPVGTTVDTAVFKFEITANRDQSNTDPSLNLHLLDVVNPDTSGTTFYYHGPGDTNGSALAAGSTYIDVGTADVPYTDDAQDQSYTLSGSVLNKLKEYYGGDNVPERAEVFFRFGLSTAATVSNLDRYRIDLAANESALEITSTAPDATAPTLSSADFVDNASGGPVAVNATVAYTVTFSEDINASTVTAADFGNAGTATVSIGSISETSPGVFSVQVIPTTTGSLRLRVNAGAVITDMAGNVLDTTSAILDDTTLTVTSGNLPPTWSSNPITGAPATQGVLYSGTLTADASDSNNDSLSFAKASGPAWLSVEANGTLNGTPAAENVGNNAFAVSVTDHLSAPVETVINITVQASGSSWRSTLYPENWQRPTSATSFYNDKLIQDFSYAGYKSGADAIPSNAVTHNAVTGYSADPTGTNDSTAAIQNAITAAGNAGGGVVYLPAGTYKVSPQGSNGYCLRISKSNVVLRGAGSASTFLLNTQTVMRSKSVVEVSPSSAASAGADVLLTADVTGPTRRLPVATPNTFAVGDFVRIMWDLTDAWVVEHNQQTWWNATNGYPAAAEYIREVVAVNQAQGWIEVDAPTRYTIKTRDNARVAKWTGLLTGSGVEGVSIGNIQHTGTTWGENDYSVNGTAAYDVHNSWLLELRDLRDCWANDVKSYQPSGNTTTAHLLSNGVTLNGCFRVTVSNCWMGRPQYGGGGGNGYMYRLQQANECLIQSCTSDLARHGFVISHAGTSGNVFLQCDDRTTGRALGSSSTPYTTGGSGSDNHMHFSHSNLWDSCHAHDSFYTAHHRTTSGTTPHGLTSAHAVYWNTSGSGTRYASSSNAIVRSEQARYGYIIGTKATSGTAYYASNPTGGNTTPADHLEGQNTGATLYPQSLYLDQLARRVAPRITYFGNGATGGTVPYDANNPFVAGSTVTVSAAGTMTRIGYTFTGWNTLANGSGTAYTPSSTFTIDNHVTLYAQWTPITYAVTFDKQSGSGGSASVTATYGAAMPSATAPNRSGYVFGGYFTDISGGGTQYYSSTMSSSRNWDLTSATTLYAKWTLASYTVTYAANAATGGTVPVDGSNPYAGGATVTVLGNTGNLMKTGYTFAGWNTAANGSATSYSSGQTFTINSNTTLHAQWTANSYTVSFDANGGTAPSSSSQSVTYGSAYGSLATTSRAGYSFKGWFTEATGGTEVTSASAVATASNHLLHAQWNTLPVVNAGQNQSVSLSGAGPWTPANLSAAAWFDASDASTLYNATTGGSLVTADGGSIARWEDKSGNNRHAIQSTAGFRPVLRANALNGKSVIDFDGTDDLLSVSGTAFATQNVFAVLNYEGGASFTAWCWAFGSKDTPNIPALFASSGSTNIGSNLPEKNIAGSRYVNGAAGSNLADLSTFDIVQASGATASASRANWWIADGDANWNGRFAELIVLSGTISTEDRQKMEGYLAHKWGTTTSLPADHPYKALAPGSSTATVTLSGIATDAENDTLSYEWSVVSGSASAVTFANASAASTTATITANGIYTLRLTASDGFGSTTSHIVIKVADIPSVSTWPTAATLTEGQALSAAALTGGSASVAGSFAFDSPGTVPAVGTASQAVTFTPTDITNYHSVSGSVNVTVQSAFDGWADANGTGNETTTGDANNDGVADGMAWLLGAANPSANARALLPPPSVSNGNLGLSFKLRKPTSRGAAQLKLQYSKDLGLADPWDDHTVTVPDTSGTDTSGVEFTINPVEGQDYHQVQATIPSTAAGGTGKVFVRLRGETP